jgi:hypothetical protein
MTTGAWGRVGWGVAMWAAVSLAACGEITVPLDPFDGDTSDAVGDTSSDVITNRAPIVQPIALSARTGVEGVEMSFDVRVSDPDGDGYEVSVEGKPDKATFDKASGRFRWRPDADTTTLAGGTAEFTVVFLATDLGTPPQTGRLEVQVFVQNDEDRDGRPDEQDDDIDGDGVKNAAEAALGTRPDVADTDGDGVCDGPGELGSTTGCQDGPDNCPINANEDQADADKDGAGDICDLCKNDAANDVDGDEQCGDVDNCPLDPNFGQENADGDAFGDACDEWETDPRNDQDEDGVPEPQDNCPKKANQLQEDSDSDGEGDICDKCVLDADNDIDGDEQCADKDNCPDKPNFDQKDTDKDKVGDACDPCPTIVGLDDDGDNVCDDNCEGEFNPDQLDSDGDGPGDACDVCKFDKDNDKDKDGHCADVDNCPLKSNGDQLDADGDKIGDACDDCPLDKDNDKDGDDVCGNVDTCPDLNAADQTDTDKDGLGDPCDPDDDNDGRPDLQDNCPKVANVDQADLDGDKLGDACDLDDDGDGAADSIDNCPRLPNASQVDLDGDLLGLACDAFETLPEALYPLGSATQAFGAARASGLAVAFVEELDCALASGACEPPGLLTLQNIDDLQVRPAWLTPTSTSLIAEPFVAQDSEAFMSVDFGSSGRFDRVVDGTFVAGVGGITAAELDQPVVMTDLLSGSTLLQTRLKLYTLFGTQVIQQASGKAFLDSVGHGVVVAKSGVVYQPAVGNTSLIKLHAFGQSGKLTGLADDHVEIRYLGALPHDPSGNPWYCIRRLVNDPPRIVQMVDGVIGASHAIVGGSSCAPDKLRDYALTAAGLWWFEYVGAGGQHVALWDTKSNASQVVFPSDARDASFHVAGPETYITMDGGDGAISAYWWDGAGGVAEELAWDCATAFRTVFQVGSQGLFGAVGRDAQAGVSGSLVACVASKSDVSSGTFAGVPTGTTTTPKGTWFDDTPDGNFYVHVLHAAKHYVAAMVRDGAVHTPQLLFETFGKAEMTSKGAVTVLGIDGVDKGIYQVSTSGGVAVASKFFDSAEAHGSALLTPSSADSLGGVWVDWKKVDGSFGFGRITASNGTVVAPAITGAVYDKAIHPQTNDPWLAFNAPAGVTYGRVVSGAFVPWREGLAELWPLYAGNKQSALWGAAYRTTAGGAFTICELPPTEACWTLPQVIGDFLLAPLVSPEGNVYALLYDTASDVVRLWRNIEDPSN